MATKDRCGLCGRELVDGIDPDEIGNSPELCLMNEPEPDIFGLHEPVAVGA
jgi:hypothetical protein